MHIDISVGVDLFWKFICVGHLNLASLKRFVSCWGTLLFILTMVPILRERHHQLSELYELHKTEKTQNKIKQFCYFSKICFIPMHPMLHTWWKAAYEISFTSYSIVDTAHLIWGIVYCVVWHRSNIQLTSINTIKFRSKWFKILFRGIFWLMIYQMEFHAVI